MVKGLKSQLAAINNLWQKFTCSKCVPAMPNAVTYGLLLWQRFKLQTSIHITQTPQLLALTVAIREAKA